MNYFIPAVSVVFGLLALVCAACAENISSKQDNGATFVAVLSVFFMSASICAAILWGQMP